MTTKTTPETRRKPTPQSPAIIAAMQPGEELGDAACPGLRTRATSKGDKVFFYRYRAADGALRQIKVGQFGPLTLAAARKQVEKLRLEREQGVDPQAEKKLARQRAKTAREVEKAKGYTVAALVAEYCTEVLSRQKRGSESERLLYREFLPKLGNRPAADVTKRELLDEVIRPMMQRAPRCATMLLSRIRCAYQHAIDQARLPDDFNPPTLGIKGAAQVRRKRAFTDAELSTFLRWLPSSPYSRTVRDAFRLCCSPDAALAKWWPPSGATSTSSATCGRFERRRTASLTTSCCRGRPPRCSSFEKTTTQQTRTPTKPARSTRGKSFLASPSTSRAIRR